MAAGVASESAHGQVATRIESVIQKASSGARCHQNRATAAAASRTVATKSLATRSAVLAIAGYGALRMLQAETGTHVCEAGTGSDRARHRVRVTVTADDSTGQQSRRSRVDEAATALDAVEVDPAKIVRRYQEEPSPLVRDRVRGWRTGHVERVWAGDFDIMGTETALLGTE